MRIVRNERSWAIDLIGYINSFLRGKTLNIVSAGGETTINTSSNVMFPDVLLYGDLRQTQILQGWEIKLPDVLITDNTFISDAQRKAETLGLNSTFLWNFTNGVLYIRKENGLWEVKKQWNETSHIRTRDDVETYRNDWEVLINEIILDLNSFFEQGELSSAGLGKVISDSVMNVIISRNKDMLATHIEQTTARNRVIKSFLNSWWREVKEEYLKDERTVYGAYAKTILLNWINRISFAHAIKRYHSPANIVEEIKENTKPREANEIFAEISRECDFYTVFKELEYNDILPESTWQDLTSYNRFLTQQKVAQFNQEALQKILERSVRSVKREIIGQYTTPPLLAQFLTKAVIHNVEDVMIDPCCGTGTIPKAVLELKKEILGSEEAHNTTWASDKFSFPLQVANIGLIDFDSINIPNRVFQSNVFNLHPEDIVEIINPENGDVLKFNLPLFDVVLSNLPFVPFEIIAEDEKKHLQEMSLNLLANIGIELDGRSDLYTYIIIHLWSLVKEKGKIGIIISNSWLGTKVGRDFYRLMRELFQIECVIISKKGRWFKNSDVVTTILVLEKKAVIGERSEYQTSYATLNVRLEELENESVMTIAADSVLTRQTLDKNILTLSSYSQGEIDRLLELNISNNSLFHKVDWLLEIKDKLIPTTEMFNFRRGERRGWDRMFYPEEGHGIESIYLQRVLMNSRSLKTFKAHTDRDAFCCSKPIEELEELGHTGALKWIRKFKDGVNTVGKPLIQSLRRPNHYWYEMKNDLTADIVTSMNPDKRLFYAKFDIPSFVNQRLIALKATANNPDVELCHALLNSMIGMFYIEATGFGRGLGALDINKTNLEKTLILNPILLSGERISEIKQAFQPLYEREVLPVEEELQSEDRINFEQVLLRSFGFEHLLETIKQSILSMHKTRLTAKE